MKLPRELLGLAGEYAVAAELCRRGAYCQLTLGQHKRTDLLIERDEKMQRVQVKAKQGREWPAVAGLRAPDEFLVLVDFETKAESVPPDFYIANLRDWKTIIAAEKRQWPEVKIDERNRVTYADGYQGLNITAARVAAWKDQWRKILGADATT